MIELRNVLTATPSQVATVEANIRGGAQTLQTLYVNTTIVETRLYNSERWFGRSTDQSGNTWMADNITSFQAISGNNTYGADLNDEAKLVGSDDTPIQAGKVAFALHHMFISAVSVVTPYKLRLIYGTGTMADAILANQFCTVIIGEWSTPLPIQTPILVSGTKLWLQAWNITNNATINFFIGLHELDEIA